jgi:hypothetical protein
LLPTINGVLKFNYAILLANFGVSETLIRLIISRDLKTQFLWNGFDMSNRIAQGQETDFNREFVSLKVGPVKKSYHFTMPNLSDLNGGAVLFYWLTNPILLSHALHE